MQSQQQKNLQTYLNNIPYEQKFIVQDHILRFIREQESFWIRTGVTKGGNDSYICFIEVAGFINIGKNLHQIRIIFPHNYPLSFPEFQLTYHPDCYSINNQPFMVSNGTIKVQKNASNQDIIKLTYPFMKAYWVNDKRHICQAFKEVVSCLNTPALLVAKKEELKKVNNVKNVQNVPNVNRNRSGGMTQKIMNEVQAQIMNLQEDQSRVEKYTRENDNNLARIDFLSRNMSKLMTAMKNQEDTINKKMKELQKVHQEILLVNNCDPLLEISERQALKIKILATKQGLQEGEKNLTDTLEKGMRENRYNFNDFKNIFRQLYQRMFQAQLQYLKNSD